MGGSNDRQAKNWKAPTLLTFLKNKKYTYLYEYILIWQKILNTIDKVIGKYNLYLNINSFPVYIFTIDRL